MACTDTVSDVNNKLYEAEDEAAPVITLEYGPLLTRTDASGTITLPVSSRTSTSC